MDHCRGDLWFLNPDTLEWYTPMICSRNRSVCSDEVSLSTRFPGLGGVTQNLTNYVVTDSVRDDAVADALTNVAATISLLNDQLITAMNVSHVIHNSSCHIVCLATTPVNPTALSPPGR
jgi:hypothetical protein